MRSSNAHRTRNESGTSAQPLIAITVALCGRRELINHFNRATTAAPSSTHGYRTLIGDRNHDTLNDRIVPHRSTCSKLASTHGTEPVHMRNGKRSRVWTPAQTASECRLSVCERPSGSEPVKATANTQSNRRRRTSARVTAWHAVEATTTVRAISRIAWSSTTSVTPIRGNHQ